jgi:hypothetical protein
MYVGLQLNLWFQYETSRSHNPNRNYKIRGTLQCPIFCQSSICRTYVNSWHQCVLKPFYHSRACDTRDTLKVAGILIMSASYAW